MYSELSKLRKGQPHGRYSFGKVKTIVQFLMNKQYAIDSAQHTAQHTVRTNMREHREKNRQVSTVPVVFF